MGKRTEYKRRWNRANPDKVAAYRRRNYLLHRPQRIESQTKYQAAHREKIRARMKAYFHARYLKNRAEILRKTNQYIKSHPEVRAAVARRWRARHPDYQSAANAKARARKKDASGTDRGVDAMIRKWRREKTFRCYYCGHKFKTEFLHVDHVVALAAGGKHIRANLARSCIRCNVRKGARAISRLELEQPLLDL